MVTIVLIDEPRKNTKLAYYLPQMDICSRMKLDNIDLGGLFKYTSNAEYAYCSFQIHTSMRTYRIIDVMYVRLSKISRSISTRYCTVYSGYTSRPCISDIIDKKTYDLNTYDDMVNIINRFRNTVDDTNLDCIHNIVCGTYTNLVEVKNPKYSHLRIEKYH